MRVLFVFMILPTIFSILNAQCFHAKVENTFNYQCTSGNPIGARIGLDFVEHTATDWGRVNVSNGTFIVYKNNINVGSSTTYNFGDVIKIEPVQIGVANIAINTDENGCTPNWGSTRPACFQNAMPVTWQSPPIATLKKEINHITWSVASQLNNEKYIFEHSNPDSYREAEASHPSEKSQAMAPAT